MRYHLIFSPAVCGISAFWLTVSDKRRSRYCGTVHCAILFNASLRRSRLQNSPYFCVFKYARAVKQKVWNETENRERDWGETPKKYGFFSLASHVLRACEARAVRAHKTLTPRVTDFLLILRKKPTVLQSSVAGAWMTPRESPSRAPVLSRAHYFQASLMHISIFKTLD